MELSPQKGTIRRILTLIGEWIKRHREHLWTAAILIVTAWAAYNLGLIRGHAGTAPLQDAALFRAREGIVSQASPTASATKQGSSAPVVDHSDIRVLVSKTSTSKKYHHPWCPGAKQIKAANQVWFPSAVDAQAVGYTLAGNCTE